MSGWFAMKRGITSHHIFKDHPERLAVWVWLLDNAAWKDTKHDINGHTVTIPRGSVAASERRIASEVGVDRQVVRTFFARLEADTMITRVVTHGRTIVTLCNWDKYQVPEKASNPPENPRLTHDKPTKETREQDITLETNVSKDADASSPIPVNLVTATLWQVGVRYLVSKNVAEKAARSLIGKWLSETGDSVSVLSAIQSAHSSGTEDPIPYITAALKPKDDAWRDVLAEMRQERGLTNGN